MMQERGSRARNDSPEEEQLTELASLALSTRALGEELRDPIAGALMCSRAMQQGTLSPERVAEYASSLERALLRMQEVVGRLADLRGPRAQPRSISVRTLAEGCAARCLFATAHSHARLSLRLHARRAAVEAVPAEAERALSHLVALSLERAPKGGEILLETHARGEFMTFTLRQADPLRTPAGFTSMDTRLCLGVADRLARRNGGRVEVKRYRLEGLVLWLPLAELATKEAEVFPMRCGPARARQRPTPRTRPGAAAAAR